MSDFRKRLLGLTVVATAFAGMSYGQTVACAAFGTAGVPNPTLRAEGLTELVADTTATTCTSTVATTGSVFATLSLPVTSKAVTGLPSGNSDAVLLVTNAVAPPPPALATIAYFGTVTGNQVSFTGVAFPAAFSMQVSNIRVNASTGGVPQVTESLVVSYATGGGTSNLSGASQQVGFILSTLGAPSLAIIGPAATQTSASFTTCVGSVIGAALPATTAFTVNIRELTGSAFKTQLQENGSYAPGGAGALASVGTASSATQIVLTLGNIPASATVYVPQSVTAGGTTLSIVNSTPVTSPAAIAPLTDIAFTPVANTVTIVYTTTLAASTGATTFPIPTYVAFAANSAAAQGPMTVLTAYAPAGAVTAPAAAVPTFAVSTATPVNASTITICQTSLLFPFVTNTQGFDTGLVIANTSTDNLGAAGVSSAKAQSGTCTLSFYGTGLPTPSTGVNDPLGNSPTAGTHAFLLSAVAPGFQGYVIAQCPFLYAHGYAFLAFNLGQTTGAVQGYLAEVLTPLRAAGPPPEVVTF